MPSPTLDAYAGEGARVQQSLDSALPYTGGDPVLLGLVGLALVLAAALAIVLWPAGR